MPIRYYLRPNPLPGREHQFMAQVVSVDTIDESGLIERMIYSGATDLSRKQIEAAVHALVHTVSALVADGHRVNVAGLAHFFPVMSGKFKGAEDEFDPKRHELGVAAAVGLRLVEEVQAKAVLEKQKPADQVPIPTYYKETGTRTESGKVIPGNIGTLHGRRLAFNRQKNDEGVFFVSASDPKHHVRVSVYAVVQPAEIVFQVPEGLGSGRWALEVRARVRGGKQVRTGRLSAALEAAKRDA